MRQLGTVLRRFKMSLAVAVLCAAVLSAGVANVAAAQGDPPLSAAPQSLFADDAGEEELRQLLRQGEAAKKALESLQALELMFTLMHMQQGNCAPALEIEGKAKNGSAREQWLLADLHRQGVCVAKDLQQTVRWLTAAASQGYADAEFELGLAYRDGAGIARSAATAVEYFGRAANRRKPEAAVALGAMYEKGDGVSQDKARALVWFEVARRAGSNDAALRMAAIYLQAPYEDRAIALSLVLPGATSCTGRSTTCDLSSSRKSLG